MTGYLHPLYARSLDEFGAPRVLPLSKGWILERQIPGTVARDAMGCYPLFCCQDWSRLPDDVQSLGRELVSLTLVTDPFGDYDEALLRRVFPDMAVRFKEHYVIDLEQPAAIAVSKHHRKEARQALRRLDVRAHPEPPAFLDAWMHLHGHLVSRHGIQGIKALSRSAFARQLATPGVTVLEVSHAGGPVAALLFLVHGEAAYGHVLACTDEGYRLSALYAGLGYALEYFAGVVRWIDLMGVPGLQDAGSERIRQFKLGWTNVTRTAWLCGRVLDRSRYAALAEATGKADARYFPAYRHGEIV